MSILVEYLLCNIQFQNVLKKKTELAENMF